MISKVVAAALALSLPSLFAADGMPASRQNQLVHDYCAVCHTDAARNGGLTLEHFDAANPDPGVAAMLVSKMKDGAFGAAGLPAPGEAEEMSLIDALLSKATAARDWNVSTGHDTSRKANFVEIGMVRAAPKDKGEPDLFRLSLACVGRDGEMRLAWSPGVPESGRKITITVDGESTEMTLTGFESMGNGKAGMSGPGSVVLYAPRTDKRAFLIMPRRSLAVSNVFGSESVTFDFTRLSDEMARQLSSCWRR